MVLFFKHNPRSVITNKTSVEPLHEGTAAAAVAVTGATAAEEGNSSEEDHGDVKYKKKNNKRFNWGQGLKKEQMDKAVSDWLE